MSFKALVHLNRDRMVRVLDHNLQVMNAGNHNSESETCNGINYKHVVSEAHSHIIRDFLRKTPDAHKC